MFTMLEAQKGEGPVIECREMRFSQGQQKCFRVQSDKRRDVPQGYRKKALVVMPWYEQCNTVAIHGRLVCRRCGYGEEYVLEYALRALKGRWRRTSGCIY